MIAKRDITDWRTGKIVVEAGQKISGKVVRRLVKIEPPRAAEERSDETN